MANERKKEKVLFEELGDAMQTGNAAQIKVKIKANSSKPNPQRVLSGLPFMQWAVRESKPLDGSE